MSVLFVPEGFCEADAVLMDGAQELRCMMIAGHIAMAVSATPAPDAGAEVGKKGEVDASKEGAEANAVGEEVSAHGSAGSEETTGERRGVSPAPQWVVFLRQERRVERDPAALVPEAGVMVWMEGETPDRNGEGGVDIQGSRHRRGGPPGRRPSRIRLSSCRGCMIS